jgi:hypothetical protein
VQHIIRRACARHGCQLVRGDVEAVNRDAGICGGKLVNPRGATEHKFVEQQNGFWPDAIVRKVAEKMRNVITQKTGGTGDEHRRAIETRGFRHLAADMAHVFGDDGIAPNFQC